MLTIQWKIFCLPLYAHHNALRIIRMKSAIFSFCLTAHLMIETGDKIDIN